MKAIIGSLIGLISFLSVSAEPLIEGRVRLESGEPVADAQVRFFDLTDLERGAVGRAMTDDTGYFALPLAALAGSVLPEDFTLGPNYPNPFNPSTIIPYQLATASEVRLEVFNLLGQRLTTLVDEERSAGFHTATWNATAATGHAVGAGVYIYRMTVGAASQTGRMVLLDGQAGVSAAGAASVSSDASDGRSHGEDAQVYGLIVSGSGFAPYMDSAFRVESGMAPVELVVSSGPHSAGKATDDDCPLCDFFDAFNDAAKEKEKGPDLIVQSPSVSDSMLTPGQAFTLNVTVHNQGDEQAAATMLHYYRSNNETITSSDTEVGTDEIGALDASATNEASIELTAPTGVSPGLGIYYGACVASVSGESKTDNNCSSAVRVTVSGQEVTEGEDETSEEETDEATEGEDETPEGGDGQVHIPDAQLRATIEVALGKASGATITVADMNTLTSLIGSSLIAHRTVDIRNLTGLEFATNLRDLDLQVNDISDVSPLAGLTKLRYLVLRANNISDVSALSGLTNLTSLSLPGNYISDVSALRGLTKLTSLDLGYNNISDVSPLAGLTKLTRMRLAANYISDVSALRGLTKLTSLSLGHNDISDVSPLAGLTNLDYLELSNNNITNVSALRSLTNLRVLNLQINSLNVSSINDHIPALKRSGATVFFDQFRESDFDIELVFLGNFTQREKRVIEYAARRWMSIIREDLPDYTFTQGWREVCEVDPDHGGQGFDIPAGERIDDLRIYVTSFDDDTGIAGRGGIALSRETSYLPVVGCMGFSSTYRDVDLGTALHEIGHVLGFGTLWHDLGFLQNPPWDNPNADTHFNGPRAIAAFNDAGGRSYAGAKVPVEWDGSHWRYSVLDGEIMISGAVEGQVLSAITLQSLADLGYSVDVTQADPYTLPRASAKGSAAAKPSLAGDDRWPGRLAPQRTCGVGHQREPIYVVDPQGRIVRTINP